VHGNTYCLITYRYRWKVKLKYILSSLKGLSSFQGGWIVTVRLLPFVSAPVYHHFILLHLTQYYLLDLFCISIRSSICISLSASRSSFCPPSRFVSFSLSPLVSFHPIDLPSLFVCTLAITIVTLRSAGDTSSTHTHVYMHPYPIPLHH
jgi:hypothetical protein